MPVCHLEGLPERTNINLRNYKPLVQLFVKRDNMYLELFTHGKFTKINTKHFYKDSNLRNRHITRITKTEIKKLAQSLLDRMSKSMIHNVSLTISGGLGDGVGPIPPIARV